MAERTETGPDVNDTTSVRLTGRLFELADTGRRQFVLACLLGLLAAGSGVGLIACAAWLISAAALQPHLVTLGVAIVGVRAFAIGKATLRYLERLTSHDAAFRMLARVRTRFIAALEPLSPGVLPVFRRGDLLGRMAADVDALQDLPLRVLQPTAVAVGVAALSVAVVAALLPASAAALLLCLLVAAVAVPAVTAWANRRAEAMQADARADMTASVVSLLRCGGASWSRTAPRRSTWTGSTPTTRHSPASRGARRSRPAPAPVSGRSARAGPCGQRSSSARPRSGTEAWPAPPLPSPSSSRWPRSKQLRCYRRPRSHAAARTAAAHECSNSSARLRQCPNPPSLLRCPFPHRGR